MSRPDTAARVDWVDTAKGIAITLVVLFHAVIFLADIGLAGFWAKLSGPLDTFRMPLFFFTAGVFGSRTLALPFREMVRRRVVTLAWVYALWSLIWALVFAALPLERSVEGSELPSVIFWLRSLVWPNESTWFLWALAVYFLVAWAMRSLPVLVQLAVAAVISAAVGSSLVDWSNIALEKSAMYFFFFLLAVHLGPRVNRAVPHLPVWTAVAVAAAYVAALFVVLRFGALGTPGVRLLLGCVGVAAGVAVSVVVARAKWTRGIAALGRRTLPVYLVHFYVVPGAVAVLAGFGDTLPSWLTPVWVPLLTAVAIAVGLGVHRLTASMPGLWAAPSFRRREGRRGAAG